MNIAEILEEQASTRPNAPAIVDVPEGRERTLTFAQLIDKAWQAAVLLHSRGLAPGDGVLIFHRMSAELYIFLLALFRLGAVALFMDPSVGRAHIEHCCHVFPPKAFFGSARAHLLRLLSAEIRRVPLYFGSSWVPGSVDVFSRGSRNGNKPLAALDDEAPALVTFTSGTTGAPKAAVRTHGFLRAQHKAIEESLHPTPGAVDLTTLPIFVLANLASGVTCVVPDADMRKPREGEIGDRLQATADPQARGQRIAPRHEAAGKAADQRCREPNAFDDRCVVVAGEAEVNHERRGHCAGKRVGELE